jgi:nitrosocyanin
MPRSDTSARAWARIRVAAVVLPVALAATACGGGGTEHRTVSAAVVQGKPGFTPTTVTVHTGDKVDLRVGNTTDKPHGFDIEGYGLTARVIEPGAPPTRIRFTARRAGTFRIFCQLHPAHEPATLVVQ